MMQPKDSWLLPEGIEALLPHEARHLESLRNCLLELFACWGYDLVTPPLIDYLDSLLTGSGHDLHLQTFKLTDQLSGEMLGIRADMTPQVAKMDAHQLKHGWPTRLCYVGTVLHTRGNPLEKSRSPMQIGAELYGHAGKESDVEIIRLMLEMLAMAGLQEVHLDLGHVGIYRGLTGQAGLTPDQEKALFDVLQRKAKPELDTLVAGFGLPADMNAMFGQLLSLNGGQEILAKARQLLAKAGQGVLQALDDLQNIALSLQKQLPQLPISFDLSELRGYHYHTGMVFAAFVPSLGREIARGGRYDNIGATFGRPRPATGFSADLKVLSALSRQSFAIPTRELIFAPWLDDPELAETIRSLRAEKRAVVQALPGASTTPAQWRCTAILEQHGACWVVKTLD